LGLSIFDPAFLECDS